MTEKRANILCSAIERTFARLIFVQKRLCELLIVTMVLVIAAEVVSRGFFNFSLHITHELAGYLLVAVTFLGIGISLHDRALFRVEFLFSRLPARGQHALQLVFDLLALGFGVVLDHQLIRLVICLVLGNGPFQLERPPTTALVRVKQHPDGDSVGETA